MNTINNINSSIENPFVDSYKKNVKTESNALDLQKNFLSLLITQIKNQDPTDPIKNTELTSQLAQINTATGIERLNDTVGKFSNQLNTTQKIQISSLIGHHVMIPSSQVVHTDIEDTKFGVELIGNATLVRIQIEDNNRKIVYVKEMKNCKPGVYNFTWNGEDLDKKRVETGKYNLYVTAQEENQDVPVRGLREALVNGIITTSDDPIIDLGISGTTTLSNIQKIIQ
ncbi:flagellar biosynthesis protein FlgD [Buchnera aphidicola (Muscaphis stroyani)]|uniref:Basal-body rod modification protein FlgD n=1 Tax=Buchnera aphidicola (Muscaphis stroyani) TaxID=1241869 RepID=A0A4D6YIX1_9GAMM|nr:flagellar hook capping FlgD N-terminal domain-containing protein [Buchnera aphidicola]QCI24405.1 flagellar biosynthesis protein FlgD [Buchnera aphidicola (Muscaphis stroyani)]